MPFSRPAPPDSGISFSNKSNGMVDLKCVLQSECSCSEKAACCVLPTTEHSEKAKHGDSKRPVVARD